MNQKRSIFGNKQHKAVTFYQGQTYGGHTKTKTSGLLNEVDLEYDEPKFRPSSSYK